ncbi:MAG: HD domain-containing protein [Candidatus Omnitrophica bacterium]|nr:HD domain-containing protein [Candidatus Omnitrophota bacterium]
MENKEATFLAKVEEMLAELNIALKGLQIYPQAHPALKNITLKVSDLLINLLKEGDLNISLIKQDLAINGIPFLKRSAVIENFKQEMEKKGIEGIDFLSGLQNQELKDFIESFSSKDWKEKVQKKEIVHIKMGRVPGNIFPAAKKAITEKERAFQKTYQENIDNAKEIIEDVETAKSVRSGKVNLVVENILQSLLKDKSIFSSLNKVKDYDDYTFTHSVDVCMLSLIQGESLNFSKDKLLELGISAFLHDLGKVFISKEILNKPIKLTLAERSIIQKHPIEGAKILQQAKGMTPLAAVVAFEHHIYYNLQGGYPLLRQKRKLHLFTMIIAIADVYDALTTSRPYHQALLPYQALRAISHLAGTQFEPFLVRNFINLLGPYPIGSFVRLNTNELGFIWRLNPGRFPWVRIVFNEKGNKLKDFFSVDLSSQTERKIISYDNPLFKGIMTEEMRLT